MLNNIYNSLTFENVYMYSTLLFAVYLGTGCGLDAYHGYVIAWAWISGSTANLAFFCRVVPKVQKYVQMPVEAQIENAKLAAEIDEWSCVVLLCAACSIILLDLFDN